LPGNFNPAVPSLVFRTLIGHPPAQQSFSERLSFIALSFAALWSAGLVPTDSFSEWQPHPAGWTYSRSLPVTARTVQPQTSTHRRPSVLHPEPPRLFCEASVTCRVRVTSSRPAFAPQNLSALELRGPCGRKGRNQPPPARVSSSKHSGTGYLYRNSNLFRPIGAHVLGGVRLVINGPKVNLNATTGIRSVAQDCIVSGRTATALTI